MCGGVVLYEGVVLYIMVWYFMVWYGGLAYYGMFMLYGMIHARFTVAAMGLEAMVSHWDTAQCGVMCYDVLWNMIPGNMSWYGTVWYGLEAMVSRGQPLGYRAI